jgi:isopenicillin N synthase-like dioxygenase
MPRVIPVIDLDAAEAGDSSQLGAVRTATEDLGAVQVVNHGVPQDLIADLSARTARLLGLPRAEKAKLASPHPYRGTEPIRVWDHVKDRVADYLAEYGRPEQIAAWRDGQPYVAELADHSAGR